MNLWDWLIAAAICVFILFCFGVFIDWMNYMDLQRRLRKEREDIRIWHGETIVGIAIEDIDAYVPVVVSDSSAPGEALFMLPDVFDHEGEIDPDKVVYLKNLSVKPIIYDPDGNFELVAGQGTIEEIEENESQNLATKAIEK